MIQKIMRMKKVLLTLLFTSGIFAISSTASADVLYAGVGVGINAVARYQGDLLTPGTQRNKPQWIRLQSTQGNLSGSAFVGILPNSFISIEGDLEYTKMSNQYKQGADEMLAIYGAKPIENSIITPFLNLIIKTPTAGGLGLFAMAGAGYSHITTTTVAYNLKQSHTNSRWSRAYSFGGGIFYQIPSSPMSLSVGFRYIDLGNSYINGDINATTTISENNSSQPNFNLRDTTKEEAFLRLAFSF